MSENQRIFFNEKGSDTVPILQLPIVQNRLNDVFSNLEEEFKIQFNELLIIADTHPEKSVSNQISYESTINFFKKYILIEVLNEAVSIALTGSMEKYNVLDNILDILSEETLLKSIHGTPMINAISAVIKELPCTKAFDKDIYDSIVLTLKNSFMEMNI